MEREHSTAGVAVDDGHRPVYREIFRQEMRLLGYVIVMQKGELVEIYNYHIKYMTRANFHIPSTGWTKFMEWKYPIEVVMTNKAEFRTTGVAAAASL